MKATCPRCGYTWEYRGKRMSVTCPNCRYTFKIQRQGEPANQAKGDIVLYMPRDGEKVDQTELWKKAGAEVELSKDDSVVIVKVPDGKAEDVLKRFSQLLEEELKINAKS